MASILLKRHEIKLRASNWYCHTQTLKLHNRIGSPKHQRSYLRFWNTNFIHEVNLWWLVFQSHPNRIFNKIQLVHSRLLQTTLWFIEHIHIRKTGVKRYTRLKFAHKYAYIFTWGPRDGAVVWGTAIHAGSSRVRFPIVIEILHWHIPSGCTMALGVTASDENEYQEYFLESKGGRCVGLTSPPSCSVLKNGSLTLLEPLEPARACTGIELPFAENILRIMLYCKPHYSIRYTCQNKLFSL
jgi:hypothetical protein